MVSVASVWTSVAYFCCTTLDQLLIIRASKAALNQVSKCMAMARATPADNGRFFNYDGKELPW